MEKGNATSKTTGWKSTAGWCFVRQVRGLSVKPADSNTRIMASKLLRLTELTSTTGKKVLEFLQNITTPLSTAARLRDETEAPSAQHA